MVRCGCGARLPPRSRKDSFADTLLQRDPPRLREEVFILVAPWSEGQVGIAGAPCTLEEAEAQAIELAIEEFEDVVLNVQGETWWSQASRSVAPPDGKTGPRRPFVVLTSATDLTSVVGHLAREPILSLDVETTLYTQQLCLVQIGTRTQTFIADPLAVPSLEPLRDVLNVRGPTKVIHNASFERRILGECGLEVAEVFDTLRASRDRGPPKVSHRLEAVCARLLDRSLDKSAQTSDWAARPLSRRQLEYAAVDAEVLIDLYDVLSKDPRTGSLF